MLKSTNQRQDSDLENSSRVSEFAESNMDQDSNESGNSEEVMIHIQENRDNDLLRSRRLFIAKMVYVTFAALVLILAFAFLIYFFTKGKKQYIQYRESSVDVDASTEKQLNFLYL